jgi:hypothetical protein
MRSSQHARWLLSSLVLACFLVGSATAQQAVAPDSALSVQTLALPKALTGQQYQFRLQARGGTTPLKWRVASGSLPRGVALRADGTLNGIPRESGEFHFVVTVADSSIPGHQRNQELVLRVLAPLLAQWSRYPEVVGQRIEGAVKISNQTEQDFDLTFIVVAVNESGRATALGYQRVILKKNVAEMEVPFGETLPGGTYQVNVDVVGEVPATNTIHRTRLVTAERLSVQLER